jgi:thiol-disulfide isomerase/thioredoxin
MQNPHTVFFYMIGCPHCERARPMWEEVKKDIPSNEKVFEIESSNVPPEMQSRVRGFPRFERTNPRGALIIQFDGAPESTYDLRKKLRLRKTSTRKRRLSTRRNKRTRRR